MFSKLRFIIAKRCYKFSKRKRNIYNFELTIKEIADKYKTLHSKYLYCHHYFWNLSPDWLKEHRKYFSTGQRGFGEDAFHAMWHIIFNEFKPVDILEIGVYRGQTLSLFSLLGKKLGLKTEIHGISPFSASGDNVSKYLEELDYFNDVKKNFEYFELSTPVLHKGFSTDEEMIKVIQSKEWDLIYIDGNHDYEVAKQDFDVCSQMIKKDGLIVLDDASLYTDYKPSIYSTAGHPGPSRVASEIELNSFKEIISIGHNRVFRKT